MRALLVTAWLALACSGSTGSSSSSHTAHLDEGPRGLSSEQIQEVVRKKLKVLEGCAIVSEATGGSLRIVFEVAPDGSVAHAEVADSDVQNPALESCLIRTFERMQFPQAKVATRSEFPFNLRRQVQ